MVIGVLVIDGPATRAAMVSRLAGRGDIEVVGTARDGGEAREMVRTLRPDVITLDVEMPGVNGLEFLEKIMRLRPTPVIVVSSLAHGESEIAARALVLGAVDCYARPEGALLDDGGRLAHLVRQAAKVRLRKRDGLQPPPASQ